MKFKIVYNKGVVEEVKEFGLDSKGNKIKELRGGKDYPVVQANNYAQSQMRKFPKLTSFTLEYIREEVKSGG